MDTAKMAACPNCFGDLTATPCPHCGWQPGADNPPPALALGTLLDGRYRIGRVLGHGGFGITYLAWDENLHLRLAIKEYLPRDCATRAPDGVSLAIYSGQAGEQFAYGLERFLEEARALARFDQHPGIVTVKSFFRAHGTGYCVMDFVEGLTLKQYLERQPGGRIPVEPAWQLLQPVMDALRAVHKEGLLHRDLAPDNIYITREGRVKLLDFGAARFAAGEHSRSLSVILKPGYAPEEQYRTRGKQGPWTDVYGLAATLYRAITGTAPPEALDRLDEDELIAPSRLGIGITAAQEAVLLKALAVKADARYSSMQGLQDGWGEVEGAEAKPPDNAPPPASPESPPVSAKMAPERSSPGSRHRGGFVWLLAVVVIAGMSLEGISRFVGPLDRPSAQSPMIRNTTPTTISAGQPQNDCSSNLVDPATGLSLQLCESSLNECSSQIAELESRFIENLNQFALTSGPSGDHALGRLREVLELMRPDQQCIWNGVKSTKERIESDGLRRISNRYVDLSDGALSRSDVEGAWKWIYHGIELDPTSDTLRDRTIDLWKSEADHGDAIAQFFLGWMYTGRGNDQDNTRAVGWYRKAAEQGDADAQANLGWMYAQGRGVAQDNRQAVSWYRKAAEQGNAIAEFYLGLMYLEGRGVAQDDRQAASWFRKAAEQGDSDAQYMLGVMYEEGRGLAQDDRQSMSWYRKAAEQGHADAQGTLGWQLILDGDFVGARAFTADAQMKDPESYAWTLNHGHTFLLEGDQSTARAWYEKTVDLIPDEEALQSGPLADFDLFIERGWAVGASREERAWLERAVRRRWAEVRPNSDSQLN
jgi:TPR repeat protein/serine/threonine protein kinase